MPPRTFFVAAASAATGALAATFLFRSYPPPVPTTTHFPPPPIRPQGELAGVGPPTTTFSGQGDQPSLVDPAGLFQYGFPGPINDQATRHAFVSGYDRRMRNPAWVAEHITSESVAQHNADRKYSIFVEDESIPERFRATLKDYFRSGYDRGHQAPAADAKWSQEAMNETFLLTNMCPQVGDGFNRDYWAHFENFCRRLTKHYPSVRIITGPLYLPRQDPDGKWRVSYEVVGNPPNVAVPTHFFKIILGEDGEKGGKVAVGAFVLPNAVISNQRKLTEFEVPVELVEKASGLEFLNKLEVARRTRLCGEVVCSVVVREFKKEAERQQPLGK